MITLVNKEKRELKKKTKLTFCLNIILWQKFFQILTQVFSNLGGFEVFHIAHLRFTDSLEQHILDTNAGKQLS
jgi:hypothetical protein